jgi:hypothetical protein
MFNSYNIANIILHITLISCFIALFFFTYGCIVEEEILKNNIQFLADNLTQNSNLIPQKIKNELKGELEKIQISNKSDENADKQNKKIILLTVEIFVPVFVVGILIIFIIYKISKYDYKKLIKDNLIILFFVGLTEFIFFTFYIKKYISINPNHIKKEVIKNISNIVKEEEQIFINENNLKKDIKEKLFNKIKYTGYDELHIDDITNLIPDKNSIDNTIDFIPYTNRDIIFDNF